MSEKKPVVIVSGLPRSGTSMMMSMMESGGMEVLTDNIRKADEDNPQGYYEFEQVKKVGEETDWLEEADGKAVKMVSMLLYELPSDRRYQVIFMKRRMEEILASQRKMLERKGEDAEVDYEEMGRAFEKHLSEIDLWLSEQSNFEVVYVNYNDVIKDTVNAVAPLNNLLGGRLDVEKMVKVVDESLYRQRGEVSDDRKQSGDSADGTGSESEEEKKKIIDQLKSLGYME